jgi:lysyl-tRNA synthetase class 2
MASDSPKNSDADFRPTATWPVLKRRAELLRTLREFFHQRGLLEVETPLVSADVVVDRHLDPMATTLAVDPRQPDVGRRLWLQTSPEFGMKRLLAAGGPAMYQITRAFRDAEQGALHNPEFTMVEWYRPGDGMAAGMQFLSDLCEATLERGPAELLSYADAFEKYAQVDPHTASAAELRRAADALSVAAPASLDAADRDAWLNLLLVERVEQHLGVGRPTILYDYPASQAALAKVRAGDPPVAERFELYADAIELANGYHELLDPAVLRQRSTAANTDRIADGKPPLPEDSRLLAAMKAGLPDSTGVALGFDRLVMIACGAKTLAEVMAFPIDRA